MSKKFISLLFFLLLFSSSKQFIMAEDDFSFGLVSEVSIKDDGAKEGDIIVSNGKDLDISSTEYQNVMVGVVVDKPKFSEKASVAPANGGSSGSKKTIIVSGVALVNVSLKNGVIRKGDWITSSGQKGVGMKSNRSGYVLGTAIDDFNKGNKDEVKKIKVSLNVHYFTSGNSIRTKISDMIKLAALAAYENPRTALKYASSIIITLGTIIFSFLSLGKISRLGIIALGRNPLASKKIYKGILINTGSSVLIIIAGVIVAFFIIKF